MGVNLRIRRVSITKKFNAVVSLLLILLALGINVFVTAHQSARYYENRLAKARTMVSMVAKNSEFALYTEDRQDLAQLIDSLSDIMDIAYAAMLKEDGTVLASRVFHEGLSIPPFAYSAPDGLPSGIGVREFVGSADGMDYFDVTGPVTSAPAVEPFAAFAEPEAARPSVIGYVRLGFSQASLRTEIRELRVAIATFTGLMVLGGFLLTVLISRRIIGPLEKLNTAIQGVTEGRWDQRVDIRTNDEIGELSLSFNTMLANLRSYQAEVQSRTDELVAANARLEREIADRKLAEESLRESEERYALAAKGANDGLWDWKLDGNEIYFSERWKSMLGYGDAEVGNTPEDWLRLVHEDDRDGLERRIASHLDGLTPNLEMEYRIRHKDGSYRWMLCRGLAVKDGSGRVRMAGSQTDVTERKVAEEQLIHDAFHDSLTGLPNRALFMDRLTHAFHRRKREGVLPFAVLFFDIDRFKVINDSLGHLIGDRLLVEIGRRLEGCLRSADTVARLGGDEFAFLLIDLRERDDVYVIVERIRQVLGRPFLIEGNEIFVTTSIGITFSSDEYSKPEQILRDADTAMYHAKANGKARFEVFEPSMHKAALEHMHVETGLRRALEDGEFVLHYQPILYTEDMAVKGFEALVRWRHPERGMVPPAEFIPIAEETGLIITLGKWVIREACAQLRRWQDAFPMDPPLTMSVNVSGRQLNHMLVEDVRSILRDTGIAEGSLILEITESVLMGDTDAAAALLRQLKDLKVSIHIDDFGTGYSSLGSLSCFPIDALKIDRSFIRMVNRKDEDKELTTTIITLAHGLKMEVIAEGVEIADQLSCLKRLNCDYLQGYLFSKPVDKAEAQLFLERNAMLSKPRQGRKG
ncbi:MAG: hypothetical protein Kow0025_11770 [Thermodesulfovibrionales bacterium]